METAKTYTIFDLSFESTFALNGPAEIGLDAQEYTYQEEAGIVSVYISFVHISVDMQQNMGMSESELLAYAKSTFIGTTKLAESYKERSILGQTSSGELIKSKIPVASLIELHFLSLPDGSKMLVSFKADANFHADKLESLISQICSSLK